MATINVGHIVKSNQAPKGRMPVVNLKRPGYIAPPKPKSTLENIGSGIGRALNIGAAASAGAVREVYRNVTTGQEKIRKGNLEGVQNIINTSLLSPLTLLTGAAKGIAEDYSYSKMVQSPQASFIPEQVRGAVGLAGDILLDPTTYVGIGAATKLGKAAKGVTGIQKAVKAGEITKQFAKESIAKSVAKASKQVGKKLTLAAPELKLGATAAERASKGQQALLSFMGTPIIKGTKVFGALEGASKAFNATKVGQVLQKAFVVSPGAPDALKSMMSNRAASIANKQQEVIKTVKQITKKFTSEEIVTATEILDKGGKLPQKLKPLRKFFDDIAKVEKEAGLLDKAIIDYVPYMAKESQRLGFDKKKVSTKLTSSLQRSNSTMQQYAEALKAIGLTPETDIRKLAARRGLSSVRAIENKKFLEEVKQFGVAKKDAPLGWAESTFKEHKGIAFPPEVQNAIESFNKQYFNDDAINAFMQGYDKVLSLWKGFATAVNPGFHIRNLISNQWQLFVGGINPTMLGTRAAQATQALLEKGDVIGMSASKLKSLAKAKGVIKGDMALADLETALGGVTKLSKLNPITAGRKIGGAVEDNSRMALFIDALSKGMSPDDAAMHVKRFLFDYSEMTDFERNVMKRIIPFYSWMRKNIPLQLENAMKQPGKYLAVKKVTDQYNAENENLPEWLRKIGPIKIPGTDMYYNPNMPFQDLSKLAETFTPKGIISSMSPFLKVPAELAFGKNLFTGAEIKDLGKYFAQQIPAANQIMKQVDPDMDDEDKALQLLSYLGGIKIFKVSEDKYSVTPEKTIVDSIKQDIIPKMKMKEPPKYWKKLPKKVKQGGTYTSQGKPAITMPVPKPPTRLEF